jgi:virginiamycin B lyase
VSDYTDTGIDDPVGITAGPDGALWFTNSAPSSIGRITTAGVVTTYINSTVIHPNNITAGPDGALWFGNGGRNNPPYHSLIGRITTAGSITDYRDPSICDSLFVGGITTGPDGALWFTDPGNYSIGESPLPSRWSPPRRSALLARI